MSNKFLDLYPKLRDPRVGDLVKIIKSWCCSYYDEGDIGKKVDSDSNRFLIDFKKQNNILVYFEGVWWVNKEHCRVIKINAHE